MGVLCVGMCYRHGCEHAFCTRVSICIVKRVLESVFSLLVAVVVEGMPEENKLALLITNICLSAHMFTI